MRKELDTPGVSTSLVPLCGRLAQLALPQGDGVDMQAELAAVASVMGKLPSIEEYMQYASQIDSMSADVYKYLNFDQMPDFAEAAEQGRSQMVELV